MIPAMTTGMTSSTLVSLAQGAGANGGAYS